MYKRQGFYYYRRKLYYGTYDEDQTAGSGYVRPEHLTPELAEHFSGRDRAVCRFWENHSLLEPEYADLQAMLSKMSLFMDLNTEQEVDFSPAEKRLRMKLPREFRLIYTALHDLSLIHILSLRVSHNLRMEVDKLSKNILIALFLS